MASFSTPLYHLFPFFNRKYNARTRVHHRHCGHPPSKIQFNRIQLVLVYRLGTLAQVYRNKRARAKVTAAQPPPATSPVKKWKEKHNFWEEEKTILRLSEWKGFLRRRRGTSSGLAWPLSHLSRDIFQVFCMYKGQAKRGETRPHTHTHERLRKIDDSRPEEEEEEELTLPLSSISFRFLEQEEEARMWSFT